MTARGSVEHELKIWPRYYDLVASGRKRFEFRRDDRDFQEGDVLYLREYVTPGDYTGREMHATVGFVLRPGPDEPASPPDGYCIMSINPWIDQLRTGA